MPQMLISALPTVLPHVKSGKLRPLMLLNDQRTQLLPDVPSAPEAGMPKMVMLFWLGYAAPAGTPPAIVARLNKDIIANATELKARPEVFVRFMRGYRDSLRWIYSTPEGLNAYANFAKLPQATAKRALQEFLPPAAVDPDRISGIEEVMADAVAFKFITAPLTKDELAELIQIPEPRR